MTTVPLHSTTGQLSGIYTRRIDVSNGGPIEQHIGQGIFNAQALQQFDECIVTATKGATVQRDATCNGVQRGHRTLMGGIVRANRVAELEQSR
mgnify:CR=1 FL=1